MTSLVTVTGYKDVTINAIIKNATWSYALVRVKVSTSGASQLLGASGVSTSGFWTTPVTGTATYSQSVTPSATGTAANMAWVTSASADEYTGTVTASGGVGNLIASTLSFVSGTPVTLSSVMKIPLNNGGTLHINAALATAWLNMILNNTAPPAMANGGTIVFYNGTQPTDADTAISGQTVLGSYTFATTDFTSASGDSGTCPLAATKPVTVTATGTAQFFRWTKGSYVIDGTVGTTGTDCVVDTTAFVTSNNRTMTALTLQLP